MVPPAYAAWYAWCVNADLPSFKPDAWIEKDRVYRIKYIAEPLNVTEGAALTITDQQGAEIHPSDSHWSFASHRFEIFTFILN